MIIMADPGGANLPPQAIDMEEAVLGAMLLEKEAVTAVIAILTPDAFYIEKNQLVFLAMLRLYKQNLPIDILTVSAELKKEGELEMVGGAYYVSSLTSRLGSGANVEFHARIILQKYIARETIRLCTATIKRAYNPSEDCFDLVQDHSNDMEAMLGGVTKADISDVGKVHAESIFEMKDHLDKGLEISGVRTGFRAVDKFTSGWQDGDLIIIAGRPGMGKTAFARACALRAAYEYGIPSAYFSLEVSKQQLVKGCQAYLTDISFSKLVKNQVNAEELAYVGARCAHLFETPLYIDDTPALSLLDLKTRATRLVEKFGVRQIYVDYLQLMTTGEGEGGNRNREQDVSTISRNLKLLARKLKVPVIALCQLSRAVEATGSKRPNLSHLRESGAIEQDADAVIFCFRPEYYDKEGQTEIAGQTFMNRGLFIAIWGKHRAGDVGDIVMGFQGTAAKVVNWDPHLMAPQDTHLEFYKERLKRQKEAGDLQNDQKTCTFVQEQPPALNTNVDFLGQGKPPEAKTSDFDTPF